MARTGSEKVIRIPYEASVHYDMCFLQLLLVCCTKIVDKEELAPGEGLLQLQQSYDYWLGKLFQVLILGGGLWPLAIFATSNGNIIDPAH